MCLPAGSCTIREIRPPGRWWTSDSTSTLASSTGQSWKAETTFHYWWWVKIVINWFELNLPSPCSSLIVPSLYGSCFSLVGPKSLWQNPVLTSRLKLNHLAGCGLREEYSMEFLTASSICKRDGERGTMGDYRARICKCLRSPVFDPKESIPPAFVARDGIFKLLRGPGINSAYVAWRVPRPHRLF